MKHESKPSRFLPDANFVTAFLFFLVGIYFSTAGAKYRNDLGVAAIESVAPNTVVDTWTINEKKFSSTRLWAFFNRRFTFVVRVHSEFP